MAQRVEVVLDCCLGIILTGRWVGASIQRRVEPIFSLAHSLADRSRVQTVGQRIAEQVWRDIGAWTGQKTLLDAHILFVFWMIAKGAVPTKRTERFIHIVFSRRW